MPPEHDPFAEALERLLIEQCPPARVRAIEAGQAGERDALWQTLRDGGFADMLVPEHAGGAGLPLAAMINTWQLLGRHSMPLALAETQWLRGLLAGTGRPAPEGVLAIAPASISSFAHAETDSLAGAAAGAAADLDPDVVRALGVTARTADWVAVGAPGSDPKTPARLLPLAAAECEMAEFELDARLVWPRASWESARELPLGTEDLRLMLATVLSAQIAGALQAVFEASLEHANERVQFGRPIGKFQAIQHQLSLLAEETFAALAAAQLACSTSLDRPDPLRVAIGKARTSEAALHAAQWAHALHGAIGFTREFDLQRHTRRLHAWRLAAGSESSWHDRIGGLLVSEPDPAQARALAYVRAATDPYDATHPDATHPTRTLSRPRNF